MIVYVVAGYVSLEHDFYTANFSNLYATSFSFLPFSYILISIYAILYWLCHRNRKEVLLGKTTFGKRIHRPSPTSLNLTDEDSTDTFLPYRPVDY